MTSSKRPHLSKEFDVFVFDYDGTLNDLRIVTRLNETAKRALGLWNKDSTIKDFKRMNYNLRNRMETREAYKNSIISILADFFMLLSKPRLHKDSVALLKELRRRNKRLALFSNERAHRLTSELAYLNILDYFEVIVSARDIRAMKPNPTGLRAIVQSMGVKPSSVLYIGDMVDDVLAAKLAHVPSCAVADGFDSAHTLKSMKPTYLFNSITNLKDAL
jgi:HAD superfamily hydrolase (TIGR01549 family)